MRTIVILMLTVLCGFTASAQITYSTAPLSRWDNTTGTFILWYGEGNAVKQYAAFSVKFDKSYTEQDVVADLKKRVYYSYKYISYDFKSGYDCAQTQSYIARQMNATLKDVQDLRVGNCTQLNFTYKKEAAAAPSDFVTGLASSEQATVNAIIAERDKALQAAGWKKIYTEYNKGIITHTIPYKAGLAYTVLGGVSSGSDTSEAQVVIIEKDAAKDHPILCGIGKFPSDKAVLVEQDDFHRSRNINEIIFATRLMSEKKLPSCLLVYERPVDFKRDFDAMIEAGKSDFASLKGAKGGLTESGFRVHFATISFGGHKQKIMLDSKHGPTYYQKIDLDSEEAAYSLTHMLQVINDVVKSKQFTYKEFKNDLGEDVTELYKDGKLNFMLTTSKKDNLLTYWFFNGKI